MRQLSRMAALLVGVAVVCVVSGCGSGGTERAQGMHQAVFTFEIQPGDGVAAAVTPRGQTTPVDGVSLKCAEPIVGWPSTGVHRVADLILGWVSVVNDNAFPITNVQARVSSLSRPTDWEHNHLVWNYGAVDAATESAPIRWMFCWTGAGSPDPVADRTTFQVTVTWSPGSMPAAASDFSLDIDMTINAASETITCGTLPAATDTYDAGTDDPIMVPPPPTNWVRGYFPHPEWQVTILGQKATKWGIDMRETLLTGGQTKTWDFFVTTDQTGGSMTLTWNAAGLPAGLSAQVIDVGGAGGSPMAVISSPFTFTTWGLDVFQVAVSAT